MKPPEDRTRGSESARRRRCGAALVILVAAVSLGTQPALSGDAVQDMQPSAIAGRARPLDLVRSSVSQVLAAVQSETAAGGESARDRAEIRRVADGLFDFNEMARLTLSRHWSAQSPRDQEEFVRLFTALLERCYLSTIENYAGERIAFGESIDGGPGSPPAAEWRSRSTTVSSTEAIGGRCTTSCSTA